MAEPPAGDELIDAPLPFDGGRHPATPAELALARRRTLGLAFAAPLASLSAVLAGAALGRPAVVAVGLLGLGATGLAIGVLAVVERRLFFLVRSHRGERRAYVIHEGTAAAAFGFVPGLLGASAVGVGIAVLRGADADALREVALAKPGLWLAPLGATLLSLGLGFAIGFRTAPGTRAARAGRLLASLPARLGGFVLIGWGAAAMAAGLFERASPAGFRATWRALLGARWPFD